MVRVTEGTGITAGGNAGTRPRRNNDVRAHGSAREAKLSSGDPGFDTVLGGGIPRESLYLVTGPPGVGKTIMALQMAFAAAQARRRIIYLTNVSEPHAKLVQHVSGFAFYEPDLVGDRINIYNSTSQISDSGFRKTREFIVDTVRAEAADLVIVDSFRGLKHILDVSVRDHGAVFDLSAQLSILGCTSLRSASTASHWHNNCVGWMVRAASPSY